MLFHRCFPVLLIIIIIIIVHSGGGAAAEEDPYKTDEFLSRRASGSLDDINIFHLYNCLLDQLFSSNRTDVADAMKTLKRDTSKWYLDMAKRYRISKKMCRKFQCVYNLEACNSKSFSLHFLDYLVKRSKGVCSCDAHHKLAENELVQVCENYCRATRNGSTLHREV
jgi:hypothetical protein